MCGIAGQVNFNSALNEDFIKELIQTLDHRGPDDKGAYISPTNYCALAHRRLSIIDLSEL